MRNNCNLFDFSWLKIICYDDSSESTWFVLIIKYSPSTHFEQLYNTLKFFIINLSLTPLCWKLLIEPWGGEFWLICHSSDNQTEMDKLAELRLSLVLACCFFPPCLTLKFCHFWIVWNKFVHWKSTSWSQKVHGEGKGLLAGFN